NHNDHPAPALTEDAGISEILTHGTAKDIRLAHAANRVRQMKAGINLHERQNYAIQLSYKPLLLLAVVAGVPVKDVQPCDPKVLLRGLRGRAHDDPVLDNLLRCISRAAIFDRS